MASLARRAGRMDDVTRYRDYSDKAVAAIKSLYIDSSHVLAGSLERLAQGTNYRDGASVETIIWYLVAANDPSPSRRSTGTRSCRRPRAATSASRARPTSTTPTSGS